MTDGASEQQAAGAGGTKPLHERYGFSSEDEMAKAFDALKADLRAAKSSQPQPRRVRLARGQCGQRHTAVVVYCLVAG